MEIPRVRWGWSAMHFVSLRLGGDLVFLEAFGAPNFYITCNKLEVIRDRSPSFLRKKKWDSRDVTALTGRA